MSCEYDETRERTVDLLRDLRDQWLLAPAQWAKISAILDTLVSDLDRMTPNRRATLTRATLTLELLAPERIKEITEATTPATVPVRERASALIYRLAAPSEDDEHGTESATR